MSDEQHIGQTMKINLRTGEHTLKQDAESSFAEPTLLAAWHQNLKDMAKSKGVEWLITNAEDYRDAFNDGLTVEEVLQYEIDEARASS